MTVAYVGLGANLDDPRRQIEQALEELAALQQTRVVKRSSLYRSAPMGFADQPEFINAVAKLETRLSAEELVVQMRAIEQRHGRKRTFPNAPRTLDLDLLLFGEERISSPDLAVPHSRMHERAFVLKPLLEISPDISIPGRGLARLLMKEILGQQAEIIDG